MLPQPGAFKGQREMWGIAAAATPAAPAARFGSFSPLAFDFDISFDTFPELFPTHSSVGRGAAGERGGGGGRGDTPARASICRVCESVRRRVHERCQEDGAVPGRGADDAHLLIMVPQVHPARGVMRVT